MNKVDVLLEIAKDAERVNSAKLKHYIIVGEDFDPEDIAIDNFLGGKVSYTA